MKILISLSLFFFSLNLLAQYEYPEKENADRVLESTLAIQLLDEENESAKFANEAIKEIFNESWKLTEVVFLSKPEIEKLKQAKDSRYAYLTHKDELLKDMRMGHIGSNGRMSSMGVNASSDAFSFKYAAFTFAYYSYDLELIGKKKPISVTKIGFANGELSKIDYLFLCQQLSHLLGNSSKGVPENEYYNVESNIEKNKNSQLTLLQDYFREKDIKKMDSYYEYDFKLVNRDQYQDVILNKEDGKTYVKIIWSHQHKMYLWTVVNAEDGTIVAQTGFGGVKFGRNHDANDIIKAKHLKYITSKMAQNVNSRYK